MNGYIVQFWPSERIVLFKYATSADEAFERAKKECASGETVHMAYPNKKDANLEKVHEVFHD